jgi:hypothetical protein
MAFVPVKLSRTQPTRKRSLFGANAPNYQDFSTPPDGDFARYVEGLMAWGEQEQERLRLKALGDKSRSTTDIQWGRISKGSPSASSAVRPASMPPSAVQPGSTETPIKRFKRKAQDQANKLQHQAMQAGQAVVSKSAPPPSQQGAGSDSVPVAQVSKGLPMALVFAAFVAAGIFAPALLPVVIIGWVLFNVIRAVRAGSSKS